MIEPLPEIGLSRTDEAAIAALLATCFPTDYGGRSFYTQRPHLRLVWREGVILSHLALFYRAVRLGGVLVDVIGVGDVATAPEARGRGLATGLMTQAVAMARASEARFGMLVGARGLYDRAGFLPAPNPCTHVGMTGAKTGRVTRAKNPFLRILPLGDRDWPGQVELDLMGPLF